MSYELMEILVLFFLGFTLAAPIGPVNIEMLKQTLSKKNGWGLGLITGFGAMTGDFIIATSVLYVGEEVLQNLLELKSLKVSLFLANIFVLSFIGISALKINKDSLSDLNSINELASNEQDNNENSRILRKQYSMGFLIVVTSPWSYLWWASFGPVIIEQGYAIETTFQRFQLTMFFLMGILLWVLSFVSSLAFSRKIASENVLMFITRFSAILILIFAVKITIDLLFVLT